MKPQRIAPGPGQESVWDYPRPPRVETSTRRIRVEHAEVVIADSRRAKRVLETSQPPAWYLPPEDVRTDLLTASPHRSFCEWKGTAQYWTLRVGDRVVENAAWSYPDPTPAFTAIRDHLAFYPGRVDACRVDDERARPGPGDFYGGWITREVVGPFKGGPGTSGW